MVLVAAYLFLDCCDCTLRIRLKSYVTKNRARKKGVQPACEQQMTSSELVGLLKVDSIINYDS